MTEAASIPSQKGLVPAAARAAEALVGLVFLIFAILKALYVNDFIVAIGNYGVVDGDALQTAAALGTLAVEMFLGTALLLGMRPRGFLLGATALLLVGFSGLIVYAWIYHGITDCGCSGPIAMGPRVSLIKNAALLVLTGFAAWGLVRNGGGHAGAGQAAKAAAALVLAGAVPVYVAFHVEPAPQAPDQPRPFAQFVFEEMGVPYDLGSGEYLVAMLSTTCEHCMATVPDLNEFARRPDGPPVVGLMTGDEATLEQFRQDTQPEFPTHLVGVREFYSFVNVAPPRFFYVRDGRSIRSWDDNVPTPQEWDEARIAPPADGE